MPANDQPAPIPSEPSATPDARWRQAKERVASSRSRQGRVHDRLVRDAATFLRLRTCGISAAAAAEHKYPLIAAAERLWLNPAARSQVMMLVLAKIPREKIAEIVGSDVATVAVAEELFFDVRSCLAATAWIHATVIAPVERMGDIELAAKLMVALCGGPVAAKALATAECQVPREEAERLLAQEMLLFAKLKAALDYPLNDQQQLEFIKLSFDYEHKRQVLELRKKLFVQRCEQDLRRYSLQKERLALKAAAQGKAQTVSASGSKQPGK